MVKKYTFGNLEEVVVSMVNRFKLSSGGEYSNPILTDRAKKHESTQLFIKRLQKNLELKLSIDRDFFRKKEQLHYLVDENSISPNINRPDIPSPTYHTLYDFTHGLTLAVNDTWGYDVKIGDYIISGNSYSAKLDVTIFDHFGLDTPDICNPCSNGEDPKWFAGWDGFVSWYILQHRQNQCYKPFITIIRFPQIISGTF